MNTQGPNGGGGEPVLRVDVDDPDLDMDEDLYYSYRDELFTGVLVEQYPNGRLAAEVGYRAGRPQGPARAWYDDGTLKSEHVVENRRVVGAAREWHGNGVLAEERRFRDGEVAETRRWDEDGEFLEQLPITRASTSRRARTGPRWPNARCATGSSGTGRCPRRCGISSRSTCATWTRTP